MKFKKVNVNPKNRNTKDCAVRAISSAFNISWESALIGLAEESCNTGYMPNGSMNIDSFLKKNGWTIHSGKGKKLKDWHFKGTHLVRVKSKNKHHLTYVEDGVIIDTWDPSYWKVVSYFNPPK